jgi:hypothetical protein
VLAELDEPVVDYVRLNILARRGHESRRPPPGHESRRPPQ